LQANWSGIFARPEQVAWPISFSFWQRQIRQYARSKGVPETLVIFPKQRRFQRPVQ
jgi:hypothetical protein